MGYLVMAGGLSLVVVALVGDSSGRQETAGIGIASVMAGMLVVVLGNYLRHADRGDDGPTDREGTRPG